MRPEEFSESCFLVLIVFYDDFKLRQRMFPWGDLLLGLGVVTAAAANGLCEDPVSKKFQFILLRTNRQKRTTFLVEVHPPVAELAIRALR